MSCNHQDKQVDHAVISKSYYSALNTGNTDSIMSILSEPFINIQGPDTARYTQESYKEWLAWDQTFNPSYKMLSFENLDHENVKIQIKKNDRRIYFLNEEPVIYTEIHTFKNGKLLRITLQEYQVFNDSLWGANRASLTSFVKEHHPELDGFIFDQTLKGAKKYQEALNYYKSK